MTKCWRSIACAIGELRLDITLACGQSFRWHETSAGEWTSVLAGRVWTLKQDDKNLYYNIHDTSPATSSLEKKSCGDQQDNKPDQKVCVESLLSNSPCNNLNKSKHNSHDFNKSDGMAMGITNPADHGDQKESSDTKVEANRAIHEPTQPCETSKSVLKSVHVKSEEMCDEEALLRDYFQLDVNLAELYAKWSKADPNFRSVASHFTGVRILRQDPVENLFSFICSSNNNISRISGMVENLCRTYGEHLETVNDKSYYTFPSIDKLAVAGVEAKLRELGFGYRARYISSTAEYITKHHSPDWLYSLRQKSYEEAKSELMKLTGVGAKVADCVCLMSLDKAGSIPVDTHVWQIASRDYMPALGKHKKTLTEKTYREIGDYFRDLWGEHAGWAHSVLFSAELKRFQQGPKKSEPAGASSPTQVKSPGAIKRKQISKGSRTTKKRH